jgi:cytochrome c oxidase subunit II
MPMKLILRCTLLLFAFCATWMCAQDSPKADSPKVIEIHAKRFSFTPAEITLVKGEPVTLALTADDTTHGLSIPDLNVNVTLNKGKTVRVEITPSQTGTFQGQCNNFCGVGHGSMLFKVTVKDK